MNVDRLSERLVIPVTKEFKELLVKRAKAEHKTLTAYAREAMIIKISDEMTKENLYVRAN